MCSADFTAAIPKFKVLNLMYVEMVDISSLFLFIVSFQTHTVSVYLLF
jgi:hypothetical protein